MPERWANRCSTVTPSSMRGRSSPRSSRARGRQRKSAVRGQREDDERSELFRSTGHRQSGVDRHRDLMGAVGPARRAFQHRFTGPVHADHPGELCLGDQRVDPLRQALQRSCESTIRPPRTEPTSFYRRCMNRLTRTAAAAGVTLALAGGSLAIAGSPRGRRQRSCQQLCRHEEVAALRLPQQLLHQVQIRAPEGHRAEQQCDGERLLHLLPHCVSRRRQPRIHANGGPALRRLSLTGSEP